MTKKETRADELLEKIIVESRDSGNFELMDMATGLSDFVRYKDWENFIWSFALKCEGVTNQMLWGAIHEVVEERACNCARHLPAVDMARVRFLELARKCVGSLSALMAMETEIAKDNRKAGEPDGDPTFYLTTGKLHGDIHKLATEIRTGDLNEAQIIERVNRIAHIVCDADMVDGLKNWMRRERIVMRETADEYIKLLGR